MVAAAVIGSAVVGAAASSAASRSAANKQSDAAGNAAAASNAQYQQTRQDQAPWRAAGSSALAKLSYGLGISDPTGAGTVPQQLENFDSQAYLAANPDVAAAIGSSGGPISAWDHYQTWGQGEGRQFTYSPEAQARMKEYAAPADGASSSKSGGTGYGDLLRNFSMADYQADPGYAFRQSQGEKAINRQAAAKGRYNSGATLKSIDSFNSDLASQEFGNAFNRYQTQQQNQYNRLAGVAGTGQQATNFTNAAGADATNTANNYLTSGAASSAAGTVGSASAINNAISGGLNYWQGQQYINALGQNRSNPYGVAGGNAMWNTGTGAQDYGGGY